MKKLFAVLLAVVMLAAVAYAVSDFVSTSAQEGEAVTLSDSDPIADPDPIAEPDPDPIAEPAPVAEPEPEPEPEPPAPEPKAAPEPAPEPEPDDDDGNAAAAAAAQDGPNVRKSDVKPGGSVTIDADQGFGDDYGDLTISFGNDNITMWN